MDKVRRLRIVLALLTSTLIATGIVMVYSTSALYALEKTGHTWTMLARHLVAVLLGLAGACWVMRVRLETVRRAAKPLLLGSWLLLGLVLISSLGPSIGGAQRWLRLGPISIQPSEIAQLTLVLYLADALTRKQGRLSEFWTGLAPLLLVVGMSVGFILLQPDLGTAVAITTVAAGLFFISRVQWQHLMGLGLASVPALTVLLVSAGYRRQRLAAFLNPWGDPQGAGFQIIQSFLALGSGGLIGVGLGRSTQKLFYLPGGYGDFIFAVIGEELGLLGCTAVIALFIGVVWCGCSIALHAPDLFGRLLAMGLTLTLGLKALINIGVATGLLPTKGLPLPFISYGGSSLVVNLTSVGLLLNVARAPRG